MVKVIESRPLSLWLADRLNVKHASPQIMLVKNGVVVWHASHGSICVQALADTLARHR